MNWPMAKPPTRTIPLISLKFKALLNRCALSKLGALGLLLETARCAFFVDVVEPAEGMLLIVESLTMEANESDIGISEIVLAASNDGTSSGAGEQARRVLFIFLEQLSHPSGLKKSAKQRNNEMVARISNIWGTSCHGSADTTL
ncbi:hypothetical protein AMTR_s00103p00012590 [Amborella trichopoda]|uniref:E3 ubiquitin ligase UBR4 C-terminal domain-containing protein n=1 Tax=Amborella trichopoda TaxID=13333 RepID=W1NZL8_AMBTC|nr:hypothetical protein AMTR_s00103p00012590 [Amborella trichopoda]